ncbi:peptidase m28 [Leptolyngbya sp. Heron Island J]|uniref:M28 family peptidase n=1 Tax=Leptolyngbya sp. Heron Island J TaxID=1385935 RepID=UPI0003B9B21D|nr:M28 family peptidase [Leptolyngbya sp. Heron Island J]ESA36150.1 peptidase m28 [Leptolyngbya sp. Heron Island J]
MGKQFRHRVGLWLGLLTLAAGLFVFYELSSKAQSSQLRVDGEQLRSHLQTLANERHTNTALACTRTYLTQQLQSYGYEPISQAFGVGDSAGINLSVVRPGMQTPEQKILVGAHYDSVAGSPGADDNASAVATVLEIARLFADYPTDKTLQVVLFDQEELQPAGAGLLGSNAFVNDAANLNGLTGAVILEMLGYACYEAGCQTYPPGLGDEGLPNQGDFIGVIGDAEHPDLLAVFSTEAENTADTQIPTAIKAVTLPVPIGVLPLMPDLFRSDHVPFWLNAIGAVMVTDTANFRNPNYHRDSDTVETLDLTFLEQTANYVVERLSGLLANS